jgi:hypothetical protein
MTATLPELTPTALEDLGRKIFDRLITDSLSLRVRPSAPWVSLHPSDEILHQFAKTFGPQHADNALIGACPRALDTGCMNQLKGKELRFASNTRRGRPRDIDVEIPSLSELVRDVAQPAFEPLVFLVFRH